MNPLIAALGVGISMLGEYGIELAASYLAESGVSLPPKATISDIEKAIGTDSNKTIALIGRLAADGTVPYEAGRGMVEAVPDKMTVARQMLQQLLDMRQRQMVVEDVPVKALDLEMREDNMVNLMLLKTRVPRLKNICGSKENFFILQWAVHNLGPEDWEMYDTLFSRSASYA